MSQEQRHGRPIKGCRCAKCEARRTERRNAYRNRVGIPLDAPVYGALGDVVEHFWASVARAAADACWDWTGHVDSSGYGVVTTRRLEGFGDTTGAHRLAYTLTVGPIPDGLEVDHLCVNRRCCNPAHLEAVTHGENTRRMHTRRRAARSLT